MLCANLVLSFFFSLSFFLSFLYFVHLTMGEIFRFQLSSLTVGGEQDHWRCCKEHLRDVS